MMEAKETRNELEENGMEESLEKNMFDPFAIFPEVVMRDYFLKNFEKPEDKWNLCLLSPSAAKLLKPTIWNWHFKELFQIPNFQGLFSKHELLNFRLVSKGWKKSVDGYWETVNDKELPLDFSVKLFLTSLSTLGSYGQPHPQQKRLCLLPNLTGPSTTRIDKFIEETINYDGNPFPSRAASFMSFTNGNDDEDSSYWPRVLPILDRFGEELRSMEIRSCSDTTTLSVFMVLEEYLEKVPHLTKLDLAFYSTNFGQEYTDGIIQLLLPKFPPLPNLTRLSISHGKLALHVPLAIYFDQLVSLNVRNSETFMEWYNPLVQSGFFLLKHFAVCITSAYELRKLQDMSSQLIEIDMKSRLTNVSPSVYFYYLVNFKKTLRAIKIQQNFECNSPIKNYEAFRLQETARIYLPKLKILSLNISKCKEILLDHLLILADSLEYLEVVVEACLCQVHDPFGEKRKRGELPIFEIRDNLYDSNVWTLMPYLQEIHVRKGPISREYKRSLLTQGTSADINL